MQQLDCKIHIFPAISLSNHICYISFLANHKQVIFSNVLQTTKKKDTTKAFSIAILATHSAKGQETILKKNFVLIFMYLWSTILKCQVIESYT